jgi:di/tricarboxylate transporter
MPISQWFLIVVVAVPLIFVMSGRLRMDVAALSMAVVLGFLQLLGWGMLGPAHTPTDALKAISGFSQPVVVNLISLFVVTRGLEKSGAARWLAQQILRVGGKNESRLIALFAGLAAVLSLFMNNLAAAALVLPGAVEAARRSGIRPSKLLIPVAYGSLLGGSATYFTTANIIVSDLLRIAKPPQIGLNIWDFTPVGGLIALAGIAFLGLFGRRLLPDRQPAVDQFSARRTGSQLESLYQIQERLWEARVLTGSPLVGRALTVSQIGEQYGVTVAAIRRDGASLLPPAAAEVIAKGDVLLLVGREEKILPLEALKLEISASKQAAGHSPLYGVAYLEIILAPHSSLEGKTIKELGFRQKFGLSVIALKRLERSYRTDVGDIPLQMGDSLLAVGKPEQFKALQRSPDWIVFEPDPAEQPVNKRQALLTALLIAGAIIATLFGVPIYLAMLSAAILTLVLKILPVDETYLSIEWQAVFLIAGMYTVSLSMVQTGLAQAVGSGLIQAVLPLGPLGVAAGAYILSTALTQVMGGQVTALVTGPITISAAISLGVSPQAVALATAIGCSASFFTPMAHPVNILMIAPANYQFRDFARAGWPLTILSFIMLLIGLRIFWGL